MIPACIVNIINWLTITHYQLTPWKAPTTILNQVSWPKTKSNQVKCKLNYQFKILWCPSPTVWYIRFSYQSAKLTKLLKSLFVCISQIKSFS